MNEEHAIPTSLFVLAEYPYGLEGGTSGIVAKMHF